MIDQCSPSPMEEPLLHCCLDVSASDVARGCGESAHRWGTSAVLLPFVFLRSAIFSESVSYLSSFHMSHFVRFFVLRMFGKADGEGSFPSCALPSSLLLALSALPPPPPSPLFLNLRRLAFCVLLVTALFCIHFHLHGAFLWFSLCCQIIAPVSVWT